MLVTAGVGSAALALLRTGLIAIGVIYTMRGLPFIPQVILRMRSMDVPLRQTGFSFVSLVIGLLYLWGTAARWRALSTSERSDPD